MHEEEPSLLSHLNEIRSKVLIEGQGGLSTVIYCGKIRGDSDLPEVLHVHREIVEDEVNREGVNVTGILIGQGTSVLHLLEGPSISVLRILNNLAGHPHFLSADAPIQSGTIAYCVEDRPKQYFSEWYSCTIQERKSQGEDVTDDNCVGLASDMATRLLEVGVGLQGSQEQLDIAKYADRLPGKNFVLSLATSASFFTLDDYVHFYFDPYHVELESEQSWPLERCVNY